MYKLISDNNKKGDSSADDKKDKEIVSSNNNKITPIDDNNNNVPSPPSVEKNTNPSIEKENVIEKINVDIEEINQKIAEGLSKETASTGTPMKGLKGATKMTASLSNIGGGSKKTGGGGMEEGIKTLRQNDILKALKAGLEYQEGTNGKNDMDGMNKQIEAGSEEVNHD